MFGHLRQQGLHLSGCGVHVRTTDLILGTTEKKTSYECYCDNQYEFDFTPEPESDCSLPCAGNPAEICGGYSRLSIYSTNGSPTTGSAVDCYDSGTPLLFSVSFLSQIQVSRPHGENIEIKLTNFGCP